MMPPAEARERAIHQKTARPVRLGPAAWAWAAFQGGRDPYVILVSIYIFAPYFATKVVGDPVRGQALVADAAAWGGYAVMLFAPLLGATVDRLGPRKPWLAAIVLLSAPLMAFLWWFTPGGGVPLPLMLATFALLSFLIAVSDTFHNALLPNAAGSTRLVGPTSGLGLAAGNFVSVTLLIGVLYAFALPGVVDWPGLPAAPLFGLDRGLHEADRLVGPLSAAVFLLLAAPLLLRVPDIAPTGLSFGAAVRTGAGDLARLVREARSHGNALTFLFARMIYTDGLTGILVFSGVYAAGAMGWQSLELLAFGLAISCVAVLGGLLAGRLDLALGPKPTLILGILITLAGQALTLGQSRAELFYRPYDPATPPLWDGPIFRTAPEVALVVCAFVSAIGVVIGYASSRTMLTRVAPPDKLGVFFGLYALAGAATMWLAPLLVGLATRATGSQRLGLLPISGLLVIGLIILLLVRGGGRLTERPIAPAS